MDEFIGVIDELGGWGVCFCLDDFEGLVLLVDNGNVEGKISF